MKKLLYGFILLALLALQVTAHSASQRPTTEAIPEVYRDLVEYEQAYNDRVENTKEFTSIRQNDLSPQYLPEKRPVFPLTTLYIPISDVTIIDTTGQFTNELVFSKDETQVVPFFIHPDSQDLYKGEIEKYEGAPTYLATPTSSHRSMIIWREDTPKEPLYIKLSINRKIGGDLRILTKGQIERAAVISYLLKTMDLENLKRKGINFVDEPFHVYLKGGKTGYTVRQFPDLPVGSTLIPAFALYSKSGGKTPLIAKLIRKSGLDAKTYIREMIVQPMISHMMELAFTEGMIGDPHEQNVLLRVQDGQLTHDFYYRDLAGFDINVAMRERAGKDMSFIPPTIGQNHLHFFRADLIQKISDYLANSNFFALRMALKDTKYEVSKEWMDDLIINTMSAEIYLKTGVKAESEPSLKAAITNYVTHNKPKVRTCRNAVEQVSAR